MTVPTFLPAGAIPNMKYSTTLHNLKQGKRISYEVVNVPNGQRHCEEWTCTVTLQVLDQVQYPDPPQYIASGLSKAEALNRASYLLLLSHGLIKVPAV
ncbi:hypothetical protein FRB96_008953 [Tulasnella sp. 330]|nr:hypothetical protein FRB96_008953 [Tulasnella sp. 330]